MGQQFQDQVRFRILGKKCVYSGSGMVCIWLNAMQFCCKNDCQTLLTVFRMTHIPQTWQDIDQIMAKIQRSVSLNSKNGHILARHTQNLLVIICKIAFFGCYQFPDQREIDQFWTHTHWYRSKISAPPETLIHPKHHQQDKLINQFCLYVFPCPASCLELGGNCSIHSSFTWIYFLWRDEICRIIKLKTCLHCDLQLHVSIAVAVN